MTISATLSTVTITAPAGGYTPDGAQASCVVTVRDESGAAVPNAQVNITPQAPGQFEVLHTHDNAIGALPVAFSYTDAAGVATIPLRAYAEGVVAYLVRAGEDDGLIPTSGPLFAGPGKPERDYAVGPVTPHTYQFTDAQTIDSAWLAANTLDGATVRNAAFLATVTLATSGVAFANCAFASGSEDFLLVTAGNRHTALNCSFRGSVEALVNGYGGQYDRCVFFAAGRDGVRLTQATAAAPIGTDFEGCLWFNIGMTTPGYAIDGGAMQNVRIDHCWFDCCHSDGAIYQTSNRYLGSVISCIRQTSVSATDESPKIFNSWLNGGQAYVVQIVDGGSGAIFTPALRSCRFGALATYGPSTCQYLDVDRLGGEFRGNVADADGKLIADTTLNALPGALFYWPQTALATVPEITWAVPGDPGDPGNPGTPGGPGSGIFGTPLIEDTLAIKLTRITEYAVGGGGPTAPAPRVRTRPITGGAIAATPVPLPGGGTPPSVLPPLVAEWDVASVNTAEGQTVVLRAELFNADGTPASSTRLTGYSMTPTVTNTAVGGASAASSSDYVAPTTLEWLPGARVAEYPVTIADDVTTEGLESFRVTMTNVYQDNGEGTSVLVVQPGAENIATCYIAPSDATPTPSAFFGITSLSWTEPDAQTINIPVRISASPLAQVVVRATLNAASTASFAGSTQSGTLDVQVLNQTIPGTRDVAFRFNPGESTEHTLQLRVLDDDVYEPAETVIYDLSVISGDATIAAGLGTFTLTIGDDEEPPTAEPIIGFGQTSLLIREGGIYSLPLTSTNGEAFQQDTLVRFTYEGIGANPAELGIDYDIVGTDVSILGNEVRVLFRAGETEKPVTLEGEGTNAVQGERRARFVLVDTADYAVSPLLSEVDLRVDDPIGVGPTRVFVERISEITTIDQMVRCTVKVPDGIDPSSAGFSFTNGAVTHTAQWHPVSYKPDGTPDTVHLWATMPGNQRSIPTEATALQVQVGTGTTPSLSNTEVRRYAIDGVALELKVFGVVTPYTLTVAAGTATPCIDPSLATTQGDGPRYYSRYLTAGPLYVGSGGASGTNLCTAARIYVDSRADVDVVVLAINWGNYKWAAADHYAYNAEVDGEVYFDYLRLKNIPAGWEAVVLDPLSSRSSYTSPNTYVDLIKSRGGSKYNYLPPLRGHVAYVALYNTATLVGAAGLAIARKILEGYDIGVSVGAIGVTGNDAVSEIGVPVLDYGAAGYFDFASGASGWEGARRFAERERDKLRTVLGSQGVLGSTGNTWGWWHGLEDPNGDNPGGTRIRMGAGTVPAYAKWTTRKLELAFLWSRVGHSTWKYDSAGGIDWATDEDFCVASGGSYRCAVAMYGGHHGQRYAHQHFYVPDTAVIADVLKVGPGRVRARATISFSAQPTAGDYLLVGDGIHASGSYGGATKFVFGGSTTGPYDYGVTIGADLTATIANLVTAMRDPVSSGTSARFQMHARADGSAVKLIHLYHGTVGNSATLVKSGATITLTAWAGGSDGTNVKPWNYLTPDPAVSSCDHDINTAWQIKTMTGSEGWGGVNATTFHLFDWPHMVRMNAATRDGWWLMLDPIAYDHSVSLMHLGTQCYMRYDIDPNSFYRNGTGTPPAREQLQSLATSNLAAIYNGMNFPLVGSLLKVYETKFNLAASQLPQGSNGDGVGNVASNAGLNVGGWVTRNLNTRPDPAAWNPLAEGSADNFADVRQMPIERGWGWLMCAVARGYCIEPAHKLSATAMVERQRLHSGTPWIGNPYSEDHPSWFTVMSRIVSTCAHQSGAVASHDLGTNPASYYSPSDYGAIDFGTRSGAFPGGDSNNWVNPGGLPAALQDVHIAANRTWFQTYVVFGLYAIARRAFTWIDLGAAPTEFTSNELLARNAKSFDFFRRIFTAAETPLEAGSKIRVPFMSPVGVGDPITCYTQSTASTRGRFNAEFGAANPETAFTGANRHNLLWYLGANGGSHADFYDLEYLSMAFLYWRLYRVVNPQWATRCYVNAQGLIGNRANTGGKAQSAATLRGLLNDQNRSNTVEDDLMDRVGHILQWIQTDATVT